MSQVVVTKDSYQVARDRSLQQEKKILKDAEFEHWHLSDVTKMYGILRAVFMPILFPVLLFWSFIMVGLSLAVGVVGGLMRVMEKIWVKHA